MNTEARVIGTCWACNLLHSSKKMLSRWRSPHVALASQPKAGFGQLGQSRAFICSLSFQRSLRRSDPPLGYRGKFDMVMSFPYAYFERSRDGAAFNPP